MTTFLIPMAGEGQRFKDAGYALSKPLIPVTDRYTGNAVPMVVAATMDLPGVDRDAKVIYVDRQSHKAAGVETTLRETFANARFVTIDYLTEGQAATCLLAEPYLSPDEPLMIGACDNGMAYDGQAFQALAQTADAIILTFRHHPHVAENPDQYGWVLTEQSSSRVREVSVKKALSTSPMDDHAICGAFWFKRAADFVAAGREMILADDRINGEFYVDLAMRYALGRGLDVHVFEIERYIGWGTPTDYEVYEKTIGYWSQFISKNRFSLD